MRTNYESDFDSDESEDKSSKKNIIIPDTSNNPKLDTNKEKRQLSVPSQHICPSQTTTTRPSGDVHRTSDNQDSKIKDQLSLNIKSLNRSYDITVPNNTAIKRLRDILRDEIDTNTEHCEKKSHVLILFTHRMHIFLSDLDEMVEQFLKLTSTKPPFYMYALKQGYQYNEMYTYETKVTQMFALNTTWWTPVCFMKDTQLPRPQSVLLSSLYVLRIFFNR